MTASVPPINEMIRCREWIESALEYNGGTHDFIHIVDGVIGGNFQFWSNDRCAVITEVIDYPNKRVLHVFLAGGSLDGIRDLEDSAIEWSKSIGCSAFTLAGRKGWEKALKNDGWKNLYTSMIKEF